MSWTLNVGETENLLKAMKEYQGDVEATVNSVLHDKATSQLIQDSIRNLMPKSNAEWNGKLPHAKDNKKSLRDKKENLAITVRASGIPDYQYLYFPDDGSMTDNHRGGQAFFARGGEAVKDDIIARCIARLTNNFE